MVRDWRPLLAVDPALASHSVEVSAARLTSRDEPDRDGDWHYQFAAALRRRGKKWPKGRYVLHAYDVQGVLLQREEYMEPVKTLDKDIRQLSTAFFCPELARAELLFEAKASERADDWESVDVRADEAAAAVLGVELQSFRAQVHRDFEHGNLLVVEISGHVVPTSGLPLPRGLCVQLTVMDARSAVLNSTWVDLRSGPSARRPLTTTIRIYDHEEADEVLVEPFTA